MQTKWPAELPALEALSADSDFTVFMAPEVPVEVRKQALRRLWRLTARAPDGLDNYAGSYAVAGASGEARPAGAVAGLEPLARR